MAVGGGSCPCTPQRGTLAGTDHSSSFETALWGVGVTEVNMGFIPFKI